MPDERDRRNPWAQIAHYSHIGFVLPAATFVGWLLGAWLDRLLGTQWLFLVGLLLGTVAGFVDLVRTLSQASRKE